MMRISPSFRWAAPAIAALWAASAPAAERPEHGAALLGPETLIYAEFDRPDALLDRLLDERFQDFLGAIPGYAEALRADEVRELRTVAGFVADRLDTTWEEGVRTLIGGGIVVGIEEADPPRLVLVVTPEDEAFLERAHDTLVELARRDAEEKGNPDPIEQAEYRGLTGYSLSDEEAHAILDGRLVISNGPDALKVVVDRYLDGGDRLTDESFFEARRDEAEALSPAGAGGGSLNAWAFARTDRLRELDPDAFGGDEEPDAGAMILLGGWLDRIYRAPWASARLDWTDDRLAARLRLADDEGAESDAVAAFFPPEDEGAPAPLKFGGKIASLNLWRDQSAIWDVREELLPPEALQGLAQLDTFAGQFFGGRDFGDSVLANLGAHWQLVVAEQDYDALDSVPQLKLPAFALVMEVDDSDGFAQRLRVAFQSFLGLANLGAAQTGAPPLMLGSETHDGTTISKATFMPAEASEGEGEEVDEEVHYRHNYSPSVAEVDGRFVVSSSVGLTRTLVSTLKAGTAAQPTDATLMAEADLDALAELAELNRERLILQNMMEEGNDRDDAERNIAGLIGLLRYLARVEMRIEDDADASVLAVDFDLAGADGR